MIMMLQGVLTTLDTIGTIELCVYVPTVVKNLPETTPQTYSVYGTADRFQVLSKR